MSRQLKGLIYFYFADARHSLTVFWTILMSILVITVTISYFMNDIDGGFMTLSLTIPMYIYVAILGFLTVKEAIPFSLKRGATRKNIFLSLGVFFLVISIAKAFVGSTLQVIVDFINDKIGIEIFGFLHIAYFTGDTWWNRILIDTAILFFFFTVMFVVGLLFYRFGLAGGGAVVGIFVVVVLTGIAQGWLNEFLGNQFKSLDYMFYLQLFSIGLIFYALSMLLLRKITIEKRK